MQLLQCMVLAASSVLAPTDATETWRFRVDNDVFSGAGTDRNYTFGSQFLGSTRSSFRNTWIDRHVLWAPLHRLNRWLFPGAVALGDAVPERTFVLQHEVYTPSCLYSAALCAARGVPINADRPYASLVLTGVRDSRALDHATLQTTELDIGLFGTNLGNAMQTWVHTRRSEEVVPQEWGTQIGNGGALAFLYQYQRSHLVLPVYAAGDGLYANYGFSAGWNTGPRVGMSARLGALRLDLEQMWVLYNQSLQGAWGGSNQITYAYSDMEPLVRTVQLHLDVLRLFRGPATAPGWGLTLSHSWRTRELRLPGELAQHRWGSVEFQLRF